MIVLNGFMHTQAFNCACGYRMKATVKFPINEWCVLCMVVKRVYGWGGTSTADHNTIQHVSPSVRFFNYRRRITNDIGK